MGDQKGSSLVRRVISRWADRRREGGDAWELNVGTHMHTA